MKVSEVAKKLDVFPNIIYRLIKKDLKDELKPNIKKINKVTHINEIGFEIIEKYIQEKDIKTEKKFSINELYKLLEEVNKKLDIILQNEKENERPKKNKVEINFEINKEKYTTGEVGKLLNLTNRQILYLIKQNKLKADKINNIYSISKENFENYLVENNIEL